MVKRKSIKGKGASGLHLSRKKVTSRFVQKIQDISGENVLACYQCGKCSAGCPLIEDMDILPSQVIRLVQLGDRSVLECKTIWLCASCLTCAVRCPKGVDLAKIMEAVRLITLRKNIDKIKLSKMKEDELKKLPQIALVASFRKMTS
ncbi:4Fe-4S dicluster domain-containing protein [Candidatus Altiarchaeota archaeon]